VNNKVVIKFLQGAITQIVLGWLFALSQLLIF